MLGQSITRLDRQPNAILIMISQSCFTESFSYELRRLPVRKALPQILLPSLTLISLNSAQNVGLSNPSRLAPTTCRRCC